MTCWVEVVRWGLSLRIWWEEWRIWEHWFQVSLASDTSEMGFGTEFHVFLELLRQAAASIGLMSAWSGQVRVDIQPISWNVCRYSQLRRLTGSNLLTFFLTYLLTFFLTYLLIYSSDISSDILSDISSDISSDIFFWHIFWPERMSEDMSEEYIRRYVRRYVRKNVRRYVFFLTYQNQNLTSTASHKKPLCKLYIYLTPRSKSNIHDNFVPVNVIALSASDRPAKRQLSPKMQNACSSTRTHTPHASDRPPNSSWVQTCKRV